MIKVLNILSSLDGGGVEMMLTNYYNHFPNDNITFDFAVYGNKIGILEENLKRKGSKIYHLTPKKTNLFKNIKELINIITNEYDIIYCHQNFISWIPLFIAKCKKIKVWIVHSHGCNPPKGIIKRIYNSICRKLLFINATNFFACGKSASIWLYGKKWKEQYPKNVIIHNAINLDKFSFSSNIRAQLRKKYDVQDKICLFHAGRFSYEKNHKFLIDLISKMPNDKYCLILAGTGDLFDEIKDYSNKLNVKNVIFLGIRKDVNNFYSMADCFLLPSYHEGFPVTLVEAQMSGLKCIASTNVSSETKILSKTKFLSLNDLDRWIDEIKNIDTSDRKSEYEKLKNSGFDIKSESIKFYELLKELCKK